MKRDIPLGKYQQARWLPIIDWNVKLFGAHQHYVQKGWGAPDESHIGFEILFILDGVQETIIGNKRYLLQNGDIILIPPATNHSSSCISEEGMVYFCAHFNIDDPHFRLEMIKNERIFFPASTEYNMTIKAILNKWIKMTEQNKPYTTVDLIKMQAILFDLLGCLAEMITQEREENHLVAPASVQYAKAIAEEIKLHFNPYSSENDENGSIKIEDIISSLGISPGYGLEVFKKVYKISPRQYLSNLKLHEAKVLLQQPDYPLGKIASALGYSHLSHFSRQFKRWTGMSPIKYRQTHIDSPME